MSPVLWTAPATATHTWRGPEGTRHPLALVATGADRRAIWLALVPVCRRCAMPLVDGQWPHEQAVEVVAWSDDGAVALRCPHCDRLAELEPVED